MARRKVAVEEEAVPEVEEVHEVEVRLADNKLIVQWWTESGIRCRDEMRVGDRIDLPEGKVILVLA